MIGTFGQSKTCPDDGEGAASGEGDDSGWVRAHAISEHLHLEPPSWVLPVLCAVAAASAVAVCVLAWRVALKRVFAVGHAP